MDNNSLLLGRIPSKGSGINKTYLESTFIYFNISAFERLYNGNFAERRFYFLDIEDNTIVFGGKNKNEEEDKKYKELEILSILPYVNDAGDTYFIAEVIRKDILYKHLQEERMLMEEMRNDGPVLTIGDNNGK